MLWAVDKQNAASCLCDVCVDAVSMRKQQAVVTVGVPDKLRETTCGNTGSVATDSDDERYSTVVSSCCSCVLHNVCVLCL